MDNLSELAKGELDSVASIDSLQLISDELYTRPLAIPDVSNIELSKRIALLELENERFKADLENMHIELNARIAANEGLKSKITELYVEIQSVLQEKQKLQNTLIDTNNRLDTTVVSAKRYQSQVHSLQASKNTLQLEIDTYQRILQQRQQTIINLNTRYKQLNIDYIELLQKHQKEKQDLEQEVQSLKIQKQSNFMAQISNIATSNLDISTKLELTEDELRDTKAELTKLEKRLSNNEVSKTLMESTLTKQCVLITNMEKNMYKCEVEKNQTTDTLHKTQLEIQKLKSENETLQTTLIFSKQEQNQIQDAIFQLQMQLMKIIAQYKLLKSKNTEAEEKLTSVEDIVNENKRLKTLLYKANSSLIRRLRHEKQKVKYLENKLYGVQTNDNLNNMKMRTEVLLQKCLDQVLIRNKDLKDQLRVLTKTSNESIDEGYGDSSIISSIVTDIPSPNSINPILLNTASSVLLRSKDFYRPMQTEFELLRLKLSKVMEQSIV